MLHSISLKNDQKIVERYSYIFKKLILIKNKNYFFIVNKYCDK
jgi:hypothetical protein